MSGLGVHWVRKRGESQSNRLCYTGSLEHQKDSAQFEYEVWGGEEPPGVPMAVKMVNVGEVKQRSKVVLEIVTKAMSN